jgi:tetratricopeptide (TPR) repeat protein
MAFVIISVTAGTPSWGYKPPAGDAPHNQATDDCLQSIRQTPDQADAVCQQLLNTFRDELEPDLITRIQIDLAHNAVLRSEFTQADNYLELALLGNEKLHGKNYYRFNWLRLKANSLYLQDKFTAAMPYRRETLEVATAIGAPNALATSNNDLGATYYQLGEYESALRYYRAALEHLERVGNPYSTALTLASIAEVYRDMGELDKSLEYLNRALSAHDAELAEDPDDFFFRRARAETLEDLGITYTLLEQHDAARSALTEAMVPYEEAQLPVDQLRILAALGSLEVAAGNTSAALATLDRALQLEQNSEAVPSIAVRKALVPAYVQAQNNERALQYALSGLELARSTQRRQAELYFLESLAEISRAKGALTDALAYYQQYTQAYKSSLEQRYQIDIAELKSSIHLKQQAQDIKALEAETDSLQQAIANQRWMIVAAACLALLIFGLVLLSVRHRAMRKAWIEREIALHRQEFEATEGAPETDSDTEADAAATTEPKTGENAFNVQLVSLMHSCLEIWEQTTGTSRVELAEQSRVWQVSIDNGRLRTRTLDRYTDINRLPKVPRWRQVVRTCRYILINCELSDSQRERLNNELESLFELQRSEALKSS